MQIRVGKWGNSLAVRIPTPLARKLHLNEGTLLEAGVVDGTLVLRPRRRRYTLEELLAGITPENCHAETDWGPDVGREPW